MLNNAKLIKLQCECMKQTSVYNGLICTQIICRSEKHQKLKVVQIHFSLLCSEQCISLVDTFSLTMQHIGFTKEDKRSLIVCPNTFGKT